MVNQTIFFIALIVFAAMGVGTSIFFFRLSETNLPKWEKLPRNVVVGTVLMFLALLWCIPQARPIAPEFLNPYYYPLLVVLTGVGYKFLDNHFARGLGGILIMAAHFFLANCWAFTHADSYALSLTFAVLTMGLGVFGLFFSGKPYLLRDLFRKVVATPAVRYGMVTYLIVYSAISLALLTGVKL